MKRYRTRVISTYQEYEVDEYAEFDILPDAIRFCVQWLEKIRDETTNERQKKFANTFISNVLNGQKSVGISVGRNTFAIDIADIKDFEKQKSEKVRVLKKELKEKKKKLRKLKKEYKNM